MKWILALALALAIMHPWLVVALIAAFLLAAFTVIGWGIARATNARARLAARRWQPWTL